MDRAFIGQKQGNTSALSATKSPKETTVKLYIADQTCSQAVQIIANELGLAPELIHFDVVGKSTSNGDNFAEFNPMLYVPVLALDGRKPLTETIVITSYLADQNPRPD